MRRSSRITNGNADLATDLRRNRSSLRDFSLLIRPSGLRIAAQATSPARLDGEVQVVLRLTKNPKAPVAMSMNLLLRIMERELT